MHPILFQIGDFYIGTYGLMIAVGLLLGIWLMAWRGGRRGFDSNLFFDFAFVVVVGGFIAARVFFILTNFGSFLANPGAYIFSRDGFVFLGGFLGAVVVGIWWVRWKGIPVLAMGDISAPSLALAHGFGRIGCHLAGCCFGGVCQVPGVGIQLERHALPGGQPFFNAYEEHLHLGLIGSDAAASLPVWPVQLIEAGGLVALALVLLWLARTPRPPGQILGIYLVAYAIMRFGLEFLRGDIGRGLYFGGLVSTSQLISLAIIPVGVGLLAWGWGKAPAAWSVPKPAPEPGAEPAPVAGESAPAKRPKGKRPR